jgi:subtilisin
MAKNPESTNPGPSDTPQAKPNGGVTPKVDEPRSAAAAPGSSPAGGEARAGRSAPGRAVAERKGQFLIAARRPNGMQPMGIQPLQFSLLEQTLRASPDIEVIDTVGPKNIVGVLADGMGDAPGVLVTRMTEQKAGILAQQGQGRLIVERDQSLHLADASFQVPMMVGSTLPTSGPSLTAAFVVLGAGDTPMKDAEVFLFGSMLPVSGVTDERGEVTLSLFGESPQTIRGLYVKPKADYWSFFHPQPDITQDEPNVVGLRALSEWPSLANFPQQQTLGWGQKAMRLDRLPADYRGQGVRIAVIDSGAANGHQDLRNIRLGFDIINKKVDPNTWNVDTISHGSHCAGVIAGADTPGGVRGFAPDAEIHVCKLFPGGQVSQLIDALEYCIEKQIDVVNLSLGGAEPSEALEQQIQRAKRAGIACIVAAGNSGGRVQYPASSPHVLAVAAIGHVNEFPPDSYHTQSVTQWMDAGGYFSAKFSCFGPEIAVCGPGVAIASSVPPDNYAVWDGTSMAAPHITGLAALVLAHHPEFQAAFKARSPERVERLFQIIRASARQVNVGDPMRSGFGLPDALAAVGLQPGMMRPQMAGVAAGAATPIGGVMGTHQTAAPLAYGASSQFADQQGQLQGQLATQSWFGNPWAQGGQTYGGGGFNPAAIDPATMAYMSNAFAQMQHGSMPMMLFGGPGYGRMGW